jgi:hypothetical protein
MGLTNPLFNAESKRTRFQRVTYWDSSRIGGLPDESILSDQSPVSSGRFLTPIASITWRKNTVEKPPEAIGITEVAALQLGSNELLGLSSPVG